MSIPLVQNNDKDAINTSIIAIKRNIERINMLLGLSNSEEIDTSEFVKKSDIVDVVEAGNMNPVTSNAVVPVDEVTLGNMQSVTSNAVAKVISYSTEEIDTGGKWINGKPIYKKTFTFGRIDARSSIEISTSGLHIDAIIKNEGYCYTGAYFSITYPDTGDKVVSWYWGNNKIVVFTGTDRSIIQGTITIFYTKTTD